MAIEIKCYCVHCGGPMEFSAELEGERIVCPHCRQLTHLGTPRAEPPMIGRADLPNGRADLPVRQGSIETRGRDSARACKGLAIVGFTLSIPGCIYAGTVDNGTVGVWSAIFCLSFILFLIGRFLE